MAGNRGITEAFISARWFERFSTKNTLPSVPWRTLCTIPSRLISLFKPKQPPTPVRLNPKPRGMPGVKRVLMSTTRLKSWPGFEPVSHKTKPDTANSFTILSSTAPKNSPVSLFIEIIPPPFTAALSMVMPRPVGKASCADKSQSPTLPSGLR